MMFKKEIIHKAEEKAYRVICLFESFFRHQSYFEEIRFI